MMRAAVIGLLAMTAMTACGSRAPSAVESTPPAPPTPKQPDGPAPETVGHPRLVPSEAYLRAYLTWFGGLAPEAAQKRAGRELFDRWVDYLTALGLPDYQVDVPRASSSNALMLAATGRLAEALCIRSIEHDLRKQTPLDRRVIFAFELTDAPSRDNFARGFDVLHRTFLSYPVALAPKDRIERFYRLYNDVVGRQRAASTLTANELGWVAVCTALAQHPEAKLY